MKTSSTITKHRPVAPWKDRLRFPVKGRALKPRRRKPLLPTGESYVNAEKDRTLVGKQRRVARKAARR